MLAGLPLGLPPDGRGSQSYHARRKEGGKAVKGCALHAEAGHQEYCQQGAQAEAAVASHAEDAHALAFFPAGNGIHIPGGLRVENGAADAHAGDSGEDTPVIRHKASQAEPQACHQDAQHHEPLTGALVCQVAKDRLDDGGKAGGSKHQPCHGGIVHAVFADEEGQQGRQGTGIYIHAEVPC